MTKVLVTGGAGFIGSHIADKLIAEGHQVCVVDNLSTGKRDNVNKDALFYRVDITDRKFEKVVAFERPEVIIHHAAQVDVSKSLTDSIFDAQVNILGALNVLNSAKMYGVRKVIYAASAAEYGSPAEIPLTEDSPKKPMSAYGISKHTVIHYLEMYKELFDLDFTALRYSIVYGPRQDHNGEGGVVAIFSAKLLAEEAPFIFGDGGQTRDFVYVGDVADANFLALTEASGQTINISTNTEISINKLFAKMREFAGGTIEPVYQPQRAGEILRSRMTNAKAKKILGWEPQVTLNEGLKNTIEYFKR